MPPSQNEELRRGLPGYVAQATPQFDAEIVEKSHLWMETNEDPMGMQPENGNRRRPAGLYLHVPFCVSKCPYCAFYSSTDLSRTGLYVEALQREIRLVEREGLEFDTIYFGGGTPSVLSPRQMEAILKAARMAFSFIADVEITVEMNPGTFSFESIDALLEAGVNRVNLGIQSFDDNNLYFLGRIHSAKEAHRAIEILRDKGIQNLGIDLIYGLPGQSSNSWERDINRALAYHPEHLSCYMLSYEQDTPFHHRHAEGLLRAPDPATVRGLFEKTTDRLTGYGYEHYEISNFARKSRFRSKHNQKYWHHDTYIGLGPSAHSFVHPRRWWNGARLEDYLKSLAEERLPVAGTEMLDERQLMLETILLGLRTSTGINIRSFEQLYGICLGDPLNALLERLQSENFLRITPDHIALTTKGMVYCDTVTSMFAHELEPHMTSA
jgi:oxygen-independent coproporphyrinogen-3 oxidase